MSDAAPTRPSLPPELREKRRRTSEQATIDRLETVEWGERHFGSLGTNRQFPRATMLALVSRGLVKSVGLVELCDDDGFFREGMPREGFVLTDAGRALLAAIDAARATTPEETPAHER